MIFFKHEVIILLSFKLAMVIRMTTLQKQSLNLSFIFIKNKFRFLYGYTIK
jgi:hypothetical protein